MLRRSLRFQSELAALVDAVLVAGTLLAALATHKVLAWLFPDWFATFDMFWSNAWIYVLVVPVWSFILDFSGLYRQFIGLSPAGVLFVRFRVPSPGGAVQPQASTAATARAVMMSV